MEPFDSRGQFEQTFSLAFDGAEIAPDPHIWDRIDAGLAKSQSSSYKKRLFIFQLVAAASLLFAATITLFQVFNNKDIVTGSDSALNEQPIDVIEQTPAVQDLKSPPLAETSDERNKKSNLAVIDKDTEEDAINEDSEQSLIFEAMDENFIPDDDPITITVMPDESSLIVVTDLNSIEPRNENVFREFPEYELNFVPVWTKYESDEGKSNMWASAGFAAGSYNTSSGMGLSFANQDFAEAAPTLDQGSGVAIYSNEESGRSVGGGIGLGGKISKKWSLESGLNYVHSEIDGTTNSVIESDGRVYPVYYETSFAGSLQNTSQNFGVTSSFDFINIPFKAGYMLVDKKIGWVATGGFGSSLLINNSLDSQLGQFEKINYSISDSPYRRISWSGIIGTEVYFNITEDYQLLVVPQYNFGITEITKQESSFNIVPNSFNLGLRFRYLLK
jgi:hypothetical protein